MGKVVLTDPYYANAFEKEKAYLRRFDVDRLAAGFRRTAGIATAAATYGGWESMLISGHFVGHYMAAVAQAWREGGDGTFLAALSSLVDALAEAQAPDGFLFATAGRVPGRAQFDNVEAGKTDILAQAWVPWYTMHKLVAGLVAAYGICGIGKALACASRLGDWVHARTMSWSAQVHGRVLGVEYGGMNDCLYELYKHTGKREHAIAAHAFDETALFEAVHRGKDVLDGRHANTTIPKFIGALNRYRAWRDIGEGAFEYGGDERDIAFYLESAERFWGMVARDHSYVTGGNSEDEHFGPPGVLDGERTEVNCETCNTYNMLKLSRGLYALTGDKKYMDFYENAFVNAVVASQNPETGMTMYFQPMATGYFKVFGSEFEHFWCCTGTGTESFTKLSEAVYDRAGDTLSVNLYISSVLDWSEKGIRISQASEIPEGEGSAFTVGGGGSFELRLRIPDWIAGKAELRLNGSSVASREAGGYAIVARDWADGDTLEIRLPMKVVAKPLPDGEGACAFKYGPVVLCAALGDEEMTTATHGVKVLKPTRRGKADERIFIDADRGPKAAWLERADENFERLEGPLRFALRNADRELEFSPYYRHYRRRYGLYWNIMDARDRSAESEREVRGARNHGDNP
jgi:uncharacterized protein